MTKPPRPTDYAPYHTFPEFKAGVEDYATGRRREFSGVREQAYDRGLEYAMRVSWFERNAEAVARVKWRSECNGD